MNWPASKRAVIAAALAAASLVAGCGSGSSDTEVDPEAELARFDEAFKGAPPEIAALYDEASEILEGGVAAFEQRVSDLEGTPIVVNKWASWCHPCREEFPILQDVAAAHAGDVAFLGVDAGDSTEAALTFLEQAPIPYPSYSDPDEEIVESLDATLGYPSMIFFDSSGKQTFVHAGPYDTAADLEADIERYAK